LHLSILAHTVLGPLLK